MDLSTTRKRIIESSPRKEANEYKLYEELYILSHIRSDIPTLCDPLCLCLRVSLISELAFLGLIGIDENSKCLKYIDGICGDDILNETHRYIKDNTLDIKGWILALNGESFSYSKTHLHIKNLRKRISKKLEERGDIRLEKKRFRIFDRKVTVCRETKRKLAEKITGYLLGHDNDNRVDVMICCMIYCNILNPVLSSLPPASQSIAKGRADTIKKKYLKKNVVVEGGEYIVHSTLRILFKM
jgi:hypothetical protein